MSKSVKLTPAMQAMVRTLETHGHIDPVRDLGRMARGGTMTSATIVALIKRGIIREAGRSSGHLHFAATTPAQVETDAYAENDRREAELAAHRADPECWVQTTGAEGEELHYRFSRTGQAMQVLKGGYNFWYLGSNLRHSAGGTFKEARAAADRFERDAAHDEALREHDRRTVEADLEGVSADALTPAPFAVRDADHAEALTEADERSGGWGQPDGMLGRTEARHALNRELGRAFDTLAATPAEAPRFPEGTPEYDAYRAELRVELSKFAKGEKPYPYPPTIPAEVRTGISDRTAAALASVTELRKRFPLKPNAWEVENQWLDVIEQALRA